MPELGDRSQSRAVPMVVSRNYEVKRNWPQPSHITAIRVSSDTKACCSNKLCSTMVQLAMAKESDEFPGYHWCNKCWGQLQWSKALLLHASITLTCNQLSHHSSPLYAGATQYTVRKAVGN